MIGLYYCFGEYLSSSSMLYHYMNQIRQIYSRSVVWSFAVLTHNICVITTKRWTTVTPLSLFLCAVALHSLVSGQKITEFQDTLVSLINETTNKQRRLTYSSNLTYSLFCHKYKKKNYVGETGTEYRLRFNKNKMHER